MFGRETIQTTMAHNGGGDDAAGAVTAAARTKAVKSAGCRRIYHARTARSRANKVAAAFSPNEEEDQQQR